MAPQDTAAAEAPGGLTPRFDPRRIAALRSFTLAEGVLMIVLGVLALIFPVVASLWVTAIVAVAFLVGGIVSWIDNLARSPHLSRSHTFWRLVVSTLFVVTGAWMILQFRAGFPSAAAQVAAFALAIGVVFVIEGLVAILVALAHRAARGWGWGLANGAVTLLLGVLILTMKFWNQLSVIGVLVGVSFLFSGIDLIGFSTSFHAQPADGHPADGKPADGRPADGQES
ncbi:DUF308 domain-containing protein [Synechococcus sp. Lug-A]|jgi:uncharacterized membrane protein HdeD (DUF308 family)|uniref:HdeD family acid-resistance protein n=2 Tax=Synechococcus TaxID=1129 RepID=UPI000B98D056|nr:DUF308 domain-containing protein [Synechococcus sp. L2F]MCP9846526.1 DUF308 domain-containing protein [Synechococcus sp. Lug-A]